MATRWAWAIVGLVEASVGCGGKVSEGALGPSRPGGAGAAAGESSEAGSPGGAGAGGGASEAGSPGAGARPVCAGGVVPEIYAHSADTLYRLDPSTSAVTTVGPLDCGDTMIDIALDQDGQIWGTTYSSLVRIDKTTAACTVIHMGLAYPNSLSFVPAGTVDPDHEALVGYAGAQYLVIDTTTGALSPQGSISGGYTSSGDIVSVAGGGTYLTVTGGDDCTASDCLVQVDPATGDILKNLGPVGQTQVYGLGYWAGLAFGFTSSGVLFSYDITADQATVIPIPDAPAGLSFYGAGSSTCAAALQ